MVYRPLTWRIMSCSVECIEPVGTGDRPPTHLQTGAQMQMLIGGTWQPAASSRAEKVTSPFDGAVIGTVPVAGPDDVRAALDRAESGAATWRRTPTEMTDTETVILHGRPW